MTSSDVFDQQMLGWQAWQTAPWGRLRYVVASAILQRFLTGSALQILDLGGGNGVEALPLAAQGHHVTIVDYSSAMLEAAERAARARGLETHLTLYQAEVAALPDLFTEARFDLVLCHNLLQYVESPTATIELLGPLLRPHGLLSIICPNPASEAYRLAMQHDLHAAHDQLHATSAHANLFGVEVQRFTAEQLIQWLARAGLELLGQYGIRCICDYLQDNERKADPAFFAQLEQLEIAMSDTYPYYLLARFMQLIARLPGGALHADS